MKKPIHLYIFATLSAIASALRIFSAFFQKYDEASTRKWFQGAPGIDETFFTYMKELNAFQTNGINKGLAVVLLVVLIATIVFLFLKKNEQASYSYLGYLFLTLVSSTYAFIGAKGLSHIYPDFMPDMQLMISYVVNIVLFVIYFGVTVFFHLRKPKEKPSMEVNATDI